jgi:nitrogenase molybdenum-iron protein alpha/beta subunit
LEPGPREGEFRINAFGEYNIGDDAWEIDSLLKNFGVDPTNWW